MAEKIKSSVKICDKKQQNFSNHKTKQKLHRQKSLKRATNYRFRHKSPNSVGQLYDLSFLPDQIHQFLNELNHLLCNIDALFICPLTFYIHFIFPIVREQNFIDKNIGFFWQIHCCWIKTFQLPFSPQNSKSIFSVGKFDNCLLFIFQMMTSLNITITYIPANFLKDITNLLLKVNVPNRRCYSSHLQCIALTIGYHNSFY